MAVPAGLGHGARRRRGAGQVVLRQQLLRSRAHLGHVRLPVRRQARRHVMIGEPLRGLPQSVEITHHDRGVHGGRTGEMLLHVFRCGLGLAGAARERAAANDRAEQETDASGHADLLTRSQADDCARCAVSNLRVGAVSVNAGARLTLPSPRCYLSGALATRVRARGRFLNPR